MHPHDLALRDANLIGSYTLATLTGRLRETAPWSTARRQALAYAPHWRCLAELASWQPLQSVDSLVAPPSQLGAALADDSPTRAWLDAPPGPDALPGLLAVRVIAAGLPGMPRGDWLARGRAYVAAARPRFLCTDCGRTEPGISWPSHCRSCRARAVHKRPYLKAH